MKFEENRATAISTTVGAVVIIVIIVIVGLGTYAATRPSSSTSLTNTTSSTTPSTNTTSTTSPTSTSSTIFVTSTTSSTGQITTTSSQPSTSTTSTSTTSSSPNEQIIIPQGAASGKNFDPSSVTVTAGTTITFSDQDSLAPHNVWFTSIPSGATNPNTAAGQSSGYEILQGQSVSYTLTTPGTYTYECQFHSSWMQGTIVVTS